MKKFFALVIAMILLASGMQVSVGLHYCGGTLADIKISVTGKLASCGMEESESGCTAHPAIEKNCCDDQISFYSLNGNYFPEYFKLSNISAEKGFAPISGDSYIAAITFGSALVNWVLPPGDNLKQGLTLPEICVFRI